MDTISNNQTQDQTQATTQEQSKSKFWNIFFIVLFVLWIDWFVRAPLGAPFFNFNLINRDGAGHALIVGNASVAMCSNNYIAEIFEALYNEQGIASLRIRNTLFAYR
jgi:hypothetical protein